jgi:hypothetical protein
MIAVTVNPVYEKLNQKLGDRRKLTAAMIPLIALALIILPSAQLAVSSVDSLQKLNAKVMVGALKVPPPPEGIGDWPIIGPSVQNWWQTASVNPEAALAKFQPQIIAIAKWSLSMFCGIAGGLFMFAVALIIAGALMTSAKSGGMMARRLLIRLAGQHREEMVDITVKTIRSVVKGIIGVSIIQSLRAGLGFCHSRCSRGRAVGLSMPGFGHHPDRYRPGSAFSDHLRLCHNGQAVRRSANHLAHTGDCMRWSHEGDFIGPRCRRTHAGDLSRCHWRLHLHRVSRAIYRSSRIICRIQAV